MGCVAQSGGAGPVPRLPVGRGVAPGRPTPLREGRCDGWPGRLDSCGTWGFIHPRDGQTGPGSDSILIFPVPSHRLALVTEAIPPTRVSAPPLTATAHANNCQGAALPMGVQRVYPCRTLCQAVQVRPCALLATAWRGHCALLFLAEHLLPITELVTPGAGV